MSQTQTNTPAVREVKIIVEKHPDCFVAYPVGLQGVVVAQGDSFDEVLREIKSAIDFHVETFGREVLNTSDLAEEVFITELTISI